MDITLKIHQGTGRLTGVNLCRSCAYALMREDRQGTQVFCGIQGSAGAAHLVRSDIIECSGYSNKTMTPIHVMEQTAWTLRTEKNGRSIGFAPPADKKDSPGPSY